MPKKYQIQKLNTEGILFFQAKKIAPFVLIAGLMAPIEVFATSQKLIPDWTPQSSEKLVKLPSTYLKKSLDSDFADSELGLAIEKINEESNLKIQTLKDLNFAATQSEGEVRTELRHQLLAEKRAYIDIMSRKHKMYKKHLATKERLFENMLKQLGERKGGMTESRRLLVENQEAASKRFKASITKVDVQLFGDASIPESKYGKKYAKNMSAIEKLVKRIESHKMNASVSVDGQPLTKEEYIRQLLAETQSEIAITDQEETIIGYMAKLVALDALSLSEEALDQELRDSDEPFRNGPARDVELFLNNG